MTANLVPTTKHTTDIPLIHPGPGLFPRSIPVKSCSVDAPTPPLTPDSGSDYYGSQDSIGEQQQQQKDALDFLLTVFPHDGFKALPHTKRLAISAPNMGASFDGIVLDHPGHPKTLYVDAKNAELVSLRERYATPYLRYLSHPHFGSHSIVALLDLADDTLSCSALIIVLERSSPVLGDLLHSLMYVGGTVVTKPLFKVDPAFVLVGLEI